MAREADILLRASEVRRRAHLILDRAKANALTHWRYEPAAMPRVADAVASVIAENYPALDVPFHARWRHFVVGGFDHATMFKSPRDDAAARAAFDLVIVSVLLDAGAGPDWRYRMADGGVLSRSEGLAIASLDMFRAGAFADDERSPRADAQALRDLTVADLQAGFQVSPDNPLAGLEGRVALLNALGGACRERPGEIYDLLKTRARDGEVAAPDILATVLDAFNGIWPSRLSLDGVALGDCWRHSALDHLPEAPGFMPFHKLSQWLSYSLIEPLQWAGLRVTQIDGLTGLPEYRNGGLFIDGGVLAPRDPSALARTWRAEDEFIVEWRALTVALLDELAPIVRERFGKSDREWPLATILEGGTWAAGRKLARAGRADGSPPLNILSDGTVF
jgi:hypothetical protein